MSNPRQSPYGTVRIVPSQDMCPALLEHIERLGQLNTPAPRVGLTGGSTPKAFYQWLGEQHPFPGDINLWERILWSCSDERHVGLDDPESNFGNAQRGFLEPLGFSESNYRPWPVYCKPDDAASRFNRLWEEELPGSPVFDLCILGMGDDCHTASLFPGSPLLAGTVPEPFAAVEVPGKGWRLTITPSGLERCGRILVAVAGAGKAKALQAVFNAGDDMEHKPIQVLRSCAEKVEWLIDEPAAGFLA